MILRQNEISMDLNIYLMDDLSALCCIIILSEIFDSYLLASVQLLVEYTLMS